MDISSWKYLRNLVALSASILTIGMSHNAIAQTRCVNLPNSAAARLITQSLRRLDPHIHLNQVDEDARRRNVRNIYLPGDNWASLNGERIALADFSPYQRVRRTHYVQDLNSSAFSVLPASDRVRLRIDFETDGVEIKGWCTGCLVGNRDARAADVNIIPQAGQSAPFIEMLIDVEIVNEEVTQFQLRDVNAVMDVDANGFASLFEGIFARHIRTQSEQSVRQAWNQFSPQLITALARELGRNNITDLRFEGNQANICFR